MVPPARLLDLSLTSTVSIAAATDETPQSLPYTFAQGWEGHDVFVKVIKRGSPEHNIDKHLLKVTLSEVPYASPYILSPIAMLDSHHEFSFMVLPLWSNGCSPEWSTTIRRILRFIECLLNVPFLHEHRIAHRDINERNILTDGYCLEVFAHDARRIVMEHSRSLTAVFAFFDIAIQLPRDVSVRNGRIFSSEVWRGSPRFHPSDCLLAEPEYIPFAFDMGCLGMMFLYYFTDAIPMVFPSAALCAKLTTWKVEQRFTAAEALSFYVDHVSPFLDERLASVVDLTPSSEPLHDPDVHWSMLDPGDRRQWRMCQVPQKSWGRRLLLALAQREFCWQLLSFVRRKLHI
ncbi:hypothetical protein C8Q74DRAFT_1419826 [Fomes fomentarius]|nr:hypothetical protein C8Q74DRAFT_1419826 [Fomes fomentarius]